MTVPSSFDVSVIIPAFQSGAWVSETLAAIAEQTLAPKEVIVVDDGSTDQTAAIAERFGALVVRQSHRGPSAARNAGIARARARWIAFCDADDVWDSRMIERHAQAFACCPHAVLSFTDGVDFDEGGVLGESVTGRDRAYRKVRKTPLAEKIVLLDPVTLASSMYRSPFILTPSVVAPRAALDAVGHFDEGLHVAEDYDLFLRLIAHGAVVAIEEPLVHVRKHGSNLTRDDTVNTEWHRKFWQRVADAPNRYPEGTRRFLRDDRFRQLGKAGEFCVRVGRFSEARTYLAEAARLRPSVRVAALCGAAILCDNPAGRRLHGVLRRAWRGSSLRYGKIGKPRFPHSGVLPTDNDRPVTVSIGDRCDG